jgi:PBP1b-binding outer membrane lipoprotein LpoB
MTRIFVFATLAFLAASCSSGKGKDASVESVKHVLKASHLRPQKVKVITTIQTTARTPLPSVNYCAAEAVA